MIVTLLLWQASAAGPAASLTGRFASARLTESSGVAVSRAHRGILWTHNDSGDGPYLYATDLRGSDRGVLRVSGARAVDWEDMALGACPEGPEGEDCLYLGDIGDNLERRTNVTIYVVAEPEPPGAHADTLRATAAARALRVRYPDGAHDVEALYVSPRDTAVYLVSKGRGGSIRLYRVPRAAWGADGVVRAELVQTLSISPDPAAGRLVTGAAIRRDGALVAVRTYTEVYFYSPGPGGRLAPAGPVCRIGGLERVGEGIDFFDDRTLVLTSEADPFGPGTIHTVRCPD
jgi:hypothetical protein